MSDLRVAGGIGKTTKLSPKGKFFDYNLLIIVMLLLVFGLVMVYSTSSYNAYQSSGDSAKYFKSQLVCTLIGLPFLLFFTLFDYKVWDKFKGWIYVAALISIVLVIPFGVEINGARRWIKIGSRTIQPVEYVKIALIILEAGYIKAIGKKLKTFWGSFIYFVLAGIPALMVMFITDNMSSAIILAGIAYIMYMIACSKPGWLVALTVVGALLLIVFLAWFFKNSDHFTNFRFARLLAWKYPERYASDTSYQTVQSLYAIGSGGFFGKGLGQSVQKLGFIPEAQNDMIFAIVCEELGIFGAICLIVLFVLMLWRFMMIASNAPDIFGSMLAIGVMAHIGLQVVLNIAVCTNVIPNTGVTLPFVSYGGTSVLFLMIEMGIVLNVSRHIQVPVSINSRG